MTDVPIGLKLVDYLSRYLAPNGFNKLLWCKVLVFILTFLSYASYHASRKPISVVKTFFTRNCSGLTPPINTSVNNSNDDHWCDWSPFDRPDANILLGTLDSAFLIAYAICMFVSGFIAERVSLRYFLALGMIFSGFSCYLFGIARAFKIHSFTYFVAVQIFGGIVQTTGWPGVVAVMANWFGEKKRGLIFGIWNSHTSVGNIFGTICASVYLTSDWGLSFIVPGVVIATIGFCVFLFLPESPSCVFSKNKLSEMYENMESCAEDSSSSNQVIEACESDLSDREPLLNVQNTPLRQGDTLQTNGEDKAIGFCGAILIPGVVEFSLCLFFAKLVSYTFLYWLPLYIKDSTEMSAKVSSEVSTIFDLGGIAGGIIAGSLSDLSGMSATVCAVMLLLSIPLLFIYNSFAYFNVAVNVVVLALVGFFVNGPYALITTAVSTELGTHSSLSNNAKALATVTAIIDGTGSLGAAMGPLIAGYLYDKLGWNDVYYMMIFSELFSLCMLLRLVRNECIKLMRSSVHTS